MRFFSIVRFYIVKNQGLSLHVPQHVLRVLAIVFYLLLLELHFAKTQENLRFEIKVCPWLVLETFSPPSI